MTYRENWIEEHIPDLTGKVAVVTGANSGLGLETSRVLALRGARVVLSVRSEARGAAAAQEVRADAPTADLDVMCLDLANLESVHRFAETFLVNHDRLDILVNNAGVMAIPHRRTADGFEMQFGTNHLGHFALTGLLLPRLLVMPGARVVTVSSGAHILGKMDFDDLNHEQSYGKWTAYGQSKLANLLFAYELQRKLEAAGSSAISVAAHPGYAATNLQYVGPEMEGSRFNLWVMSTANRVFAQHAAMGALPEIYAATSPEVRGGDYVGPGGLLGSRGFPAKAKSSRRSHDPAPAARLWAVSERLTGVTYTFPRSSKAPGPLEAPGAS
jgi:NAD(P)-dependent dehydrogenase (short-subunit alcohol dehydrogenase family)